MSSYADFGTMLVETDVDRLVIQRLNLWLPTYLAQAERERELPNRLLARPHGFQNVLEDDDFPDAGLPAVVVTTAQTDDVDRGSLGYMAGWQVVVSAIVRGRTAPETREVAALYGGCIRRILVQQQLDEDGEVIWTGSSVAPVADQTDKGRWLAAGINVFRVHTDVVVSGDGPVLPDDDDPYPAPDPEGDPDEPYEPLVPVTTVTTNIIPRS